MPACIFPPQAGAIKNLQTDRSAPGQGDRMVSIRSCRRVSTAKILVASMSAAVAGEALGSAFALQEQNASGLGNAYAGGAAVAEDVSTVFYNPAGLTRFPTVQMLVAANVICPSAKFQDS